MTHLQTDSFNRPVFPWWCVFALWVSVCVGGVFEKWCSLGKKKESVEEKSLCGMRFQCHQSHHCGMRLIFGFPPPKIGL